MKRLTQSGNSGYDDAEKSQQYWDDDWEEEGSCHAKGTDHRKSKSRAAARKKTNRPMQDYPEGEFDGN
ncbi:MAG: hypothetical protein JW741_24200 [Sedimentisphaerales bacterium]|nr:hypothetical protein [Sedimentisphaerales bacterium]